MDQSCLMTIPELMKFLKVKRNTIYTLRKMGLPTVKIGRSVRFMVDSVQKWLGEMEQKSDIEIRRASSLSHDTSHLL